MIGQVLDLPGAPGVIRTRDLRIRSPALYPTELRARLPPHRRGGEDYIRRSCFGKPEMAFSRRGMPPFSSGGI